VVCKERLSQLINCDSSNFSQYGKLFRDFFTQWKEFFHTVENLLWAEKTGSGRGKEVGCTRVMREVVQYICLSGMVLCGALSVWPFRFSQRWLSWNLYLPVAAVLLYGFYEFSLPAEIDIHRKMVFILPMLLFICLNGMAKVGVLAYWMPRARGSRRRLQTMPLRRIQVAISMLILLGCGAWVWTMWP